MQEKLIIGYEKDNKEIIPLLKKEEVEYKVFEITPERYNMEGGKVVEEILATITALKEFPINIKDKCLIYTPAKPIYYEIFYEGKKIHFCYVIPDKYCDILVNKIDKAFKTATIKERNDYFNDFYKGYSCKFLQKEHFMFSLNVDYRENGLIDGLLSVLSNVDDNDKVLFQIGIIPLDDNWKELWKQAYLRYRKGEKLEIHTSIPLLFFDTLFSIGDGIMNTLDMIIGRPKDKETEIETKMMNMLSSKFNKNADIGYNYFKSRRMTFQKINYNGYLTQIKIFCNNSYKIRYYTKIFEGVFKVIDADQELQTGSIKQYKIPYRKFDYQIAKNIFSAKELSIFMQLPNRRMQIEYASHMKSIETLEIKIPEQLLNGQIPIGEATYKGKKFMTYWNTKDYDMAPMHKVITGLQRTGKSSYIKNFAIEAIKAGHSVFVVDTIKNCEVANDIRDYMPEQYKDKIIVLDFNNLDYMFPLAWNELRKYNNPHDTRSKLMLASMMAGNLKRFLETVGELKSAEDRFSPRMLHYLASACKLVFAQPNTNIKDIIDCLIEASVRDKFIKASGLPTNNTIIQDLRRLDDGKGGTNYKEIAGIIDRASILLNDYTMEMLLSIPPNDNIDFTKWANEGYCVLIKMSDLTFNRDALQALVTFIYSKIWLSMLSRGQQDKPRIAHIILDEVHNFPQVCDMLKNTCREAAKFGLSYVFTSHSLLDLKGLLPYIKASGASFILFKTTKENINLLKEELELHGFDLEQCIKIKDYHTINIVNYDRDYVVYISKVIDPVNKRFIRNNRNYIDLECSKKYGVKYKE